MNLAKKCVSLLMAVALVFCVLPTSGVNAEAKKEKFEVIVSSDVSGSTTEVKGVVYDDYSAQLTLPNKNVNASNVSVTVRATDISSFGINGTREQTISVTNTGMNGVYNLYYALSRVNDTERLFHFNDSTIHAIITTSGIEHEVEYQITGSAFDEADPSDKVISAVTDTEQARKAWAAMANGCYLETATYGVEDSYIIIAKGSTLQIGKEILQFEEDSDDLKLDNLTDLSALVSNVRDHVTVKEADSSALEFTLAKGTTVVLGYTSVKLAVDVKVDANKHASLFENSDILSQLRDSESIESMVLYSLQFMNDMVGLADDADDLYVNITFEEGAGHNWGEDI